jgi:hypothetical protein
MTEELIVKGNSGGTNFPPHPEDQYAATCIDIIDLGMVETTWQGKTKRQHKVVLRFFCDEWMKDNEGKDRPLWVDKRLTFSLHEKGNMRPFLEAWRGQKFTNEEVEYGFNIAKLLHAPAFIQVVHNATADRTYANIATIMRLPKGMTAPKVPTDYVRVKDRPPRDQPNGNGHGREPAPSNEWGGHSEPDDDLPF